MENLSKLFPYVSIQFVIICCSVFDVVDFFAYLGQFRYRKTLRRPGYENAHFLVNHGFHRFCQIWYLFSCQIILLQRFFFPSTFITIFTAPFICISTIVVVMWTYLFIFQHNSGIGYLVIGFQRSFTSFKSFSALLFLIFISFVFGTRILLAISCKGDNFLDAFYVTFKIFLNQVNIDELSEGRHVVEWRAFHVVFVVVTTILLLNYFIAVLSESMMAVSSHKRVIQRLIYLNTAVILDERFGWLIRRIIRKRGKINPGKIVVREGL